jgi:hypothetical protein
MRSSLLAFVIVALGTSTGYCFDEPIVILTGSLPPAQAPQQLTQAPAGGQLIQGADGRIYIVAAPTPPLINPPVTLPPQVSPRIYLNPLTGQWEYYPANNQVIVTLPQLPGGLTAPPLVPGLQQIPGTCGRRQGGAYLTAGVQVVGTQPQTHPVFLGQGAQLGNGVLDLGLSLGR